MLSQRSHLKFGNKPCKLTSEEWKTNLKKLEAITTAIQHNHLADLRTEEERYLNLNQKLQKANDELENIELD
jgi:hypothetical protein